jgi:LysM repeat protein
MSNPFIEPGSIKVELERRRRERFKTGVYAVLGTATIFLIGMLIQGCRHQQQALSDPTADVQANAATNLISSQAASNSVATQQAGSSNAIATAPTPSAEVVGSNSIPAPSILDAPAPITSPDFTLYTVKRGDSLARIARQHGTTIKAIKTANGLKSDLLPAGRKLKLPKTHPTAAALAGI